MNSKDKQYDIEVSGERRRYNRFPLKLRLHYRLSSNSNHVEARTKNIGLGGLALISNKPIAVGETIYIQVFLHEAKNREVQIDFPESENHSFELSGQVVWNARLGDEYLSGIDFKNMDDLQSSRLKELLQDYDLILFPLNKKGEIS